MNQRVEQLRQTDRDSDRGEPAPLPKSPNLFPLDQRFPNRCSIGSARESGDLKKDQVNLKKIKANVVHLGQVHWVEQRDSLPTIRMQNLNSQLTIARYLLSHPEAEVFSESITAPPPEGAPQWINLGDVPTLRSIFPHGFPDDLNTLNHSQKEVLRRLGAVRVLNYFGKIKPIHPVISAQKLAEIQAALNGASLLNRAFPRWGNLGRSIIDGQEAALAEAIQAFIATQGDTDREIIIVFGDGHDLSKHFDPNKYKHISTQ